MGLYFSALDGLIYKRGIILQFYTLSGAQWLGDLQMVCVGGSRSPIALHSDLSSVCHWEKTLHL